MHSFQTTKAIFHFNQDLSGDIIIVPLNESGEPQPEQYVDGDSLVSFVISQLRDKESSRIESMTDEEFVAYLLS